MNDAANLQTFSRSQRVYYEDTDAGGIVYHARYLHFMERCRCDWFDALGFNIADYQHQHQRMFVVHRITIEYHAPAKLFDQLEVQCYALQVGKVAMRLQQKIYNQDRLVCTAEIRLACIHCESHALVKIPADLRAKIETHS